MSLKSSQHYRNQLQASSPSQPLLKYSCSVTIRDPMAVLRANQKVEFYALCFVLFELRWVEETVTCPLNLDLSKCMQRNVCTSMATSCKLPFLRSPFQVWPVFSPTEIMVSNISITVKLPQFSCRGKHPLVYEEKKKS